MSPLINSAFYTDEIKKEANHYHDCHQIIFVVKGTEEININGKKHYANAGDLAITSRLENHSVSVVSLESERYILRINPLEINYENKSYALFLNRPLGFKNIINSGEHKDEYIYLFNKLINERKNAKDFSSEMQEALLNQILILISRNLYNTLPNFNDNGSMIISDLQRRFMNECEKEYKLEDLADEYHISVSTLSHQFKKITGFSIFEYLQSCRIALAKHYLTQTDISVSEIVFRCGFSDSSNFSRTFKNATKFTPSQFRKEYSFI